MSLIRDLEYVRVCVTLQAHSEPALMPKLFVDFMQISCRSLCASGYIRRRDLQNG